MNDLDAKLVDNIFACALTLGAGERARFVDEQCAGDIGLRRRVRALLTASEAGDASFDNRFGGVRDRLTQAVLGRDNETCSEDLSGSRINTWRIEKRLARGGLATVYLAHRDDGEYDQRVAFKVLRRGLDTDDLVARFRAERQILSSLEHPAIARILDGGALDDGRPYLVLEYVDGRRITQYCRQNKLRVPARIRLMLEVLRALQHAHKHLVVHRDIKPSNILVSNEGNVALLDFGIAKLLDPGTIPGASTSTRTGISMLTPGYCSPEQHAGEPVTTASDIYQAGAVLYELLLHKRPLTAADDATLAAAETHTVRAKPRAEIGGDLGAIVGKAMHADPAARYVAADAMRADLQRYLDGQPVSARPDTLRYRMAKFIRRRPWALPVAVVAALAVVGYMLTLRAYNERLLVEQRRASAAQMFMVDLLQSPDPFRPADADLGSKITVVEALDLGVARLRTSVLDDAELRASLLASIASVYASLDQHRQAIELREEALALERDLYGEPSPEVLESVGLLGRQYLAQGSYQRAAGFHAEQLAMARALYPGEDPALGAVEADAAAVALTAGDRAGARRLLDDAIHKLRAAPGEHAQALISALVARASLSSDSSQPQAMELLQEARMLAEDLYGPDSLSAALVSAQTATTLSVKGDYALAEAEFKKAIRIYEDRIGRNHGATLSTINNLGILYMHAEDYAHAESTLRKVLQGYEEKFGGQHRMLAASFQNLAVVLARQGRYREAIPLHRQAFDAYNDILPEENSVLAYPLLSLAHAQVQTGEFAAAEATARRALDLLEKSAPGTYLSGVAQCMVGLALAGRLGPAAGQAMLQTARQSLVGSAASATYREACRVPAP